MKLTLDAQVQLNAQRIEKIKNDIDLIMNNHLVHIQDDVSELKANINELNADVKQILKIIAENKNG